MCIHVVYVMCILSSRSDWIYNCTNCHDAVLCTNSRAVLGSLHTLSYHFLITAQYITLRVGIECVSRYLWTILPSAYRS